MDQHEKHVFISYQHDDNDFAENLIHRVKAAGFTTWIDSDGLSVGDPWREGIDQAIRNAFALIVIMSPTAKASEYVTYEWAFAWGCGLKVIPIMYRKTELHPRLESLQYMDFTNRSLRPWDNLMKTLQVAVCESSPASHLTAQKMRGWIDKGELFLERTDYEEALAAFREAILLDPNSAEAYVGKSHALWRLKKYHEALTASQQAIRLDASIARAWNYQANILASLKKYDEALSAYEEALRLDPKYAVAWSNKGNVLFVSLKKYDEALSAYEEALRFENNNPGTWHNKGNILYNLGRLEEALLAYEEVIRLNSDNAVIWHDKGDTLKELGRLQEAEQCYNKFYESGYKVGEKV